MTIKSNPFNFGSSMLNMQERVTLGVPTITTDHAAIHAGIGFSVTSKMDIASAQVGGILVSPPDNVAATVTINMTNASADLTYTAVNYGTEGNDISVTHVDPGGTTAALVISVSGTDISISLARAANAITSTAAQIKAAVNAHAEASLLVVCEDEGSGTGIVNAVTHTHLSGGTYKAYVHFKTVGVSTLAGPVHVSILEDYTVTGTTASLPVINRNRISTNTSIVPCIGGTNLTAVAGSTPITLATMSLSGSSTGVTKIGSSSPSAEEWILEPGKNYLIAVTNATSPGATATVSYDLFWYEESGA